MKHNWKHIKFGDAFNLQMGKTPARANSAYWSNGLYDWVSISDMPNGKYIQGTKEKISQKAVDETGIHLVKKGTALMSFKLTIGKTAIAPYDLYTNEAIMAFEPKDGTDVLADFLYYYLQLYEWDGNRAVMGNTTNKGVISNSYAYIPSLDEQQAIVRELDGINRLIDLQEEQLREYDRLAQSLFYTTFGDPVSNPKGWEVKKLGDVCKFSQGMQAPIEEQFEECKEGYTQFLRIIDFTQGKDAPRYVKCTDEKYILHDGEIAIVRYGTPGFVCYGKMGAIANNLFKITPVDHNLFVYDYLRYWLQTDAFQQTVKGNQYGAALQAIKFNTISSIATILPPLHLQQAFAAQIEAIEQQKALIRRSLDDTRTLLAARMQYYFE